MLGFRSRLRFLLGQKRLVLAFLVIQGVAAAAAQTPSVLTATNTDPVIQFPAPSAEGPSNSAPSPRLSPLPAEDDGDGLNGDDLWRNEIAGRRPGTQGVTINDLPIYQVAGIIEDNAGLPIAQARVTLETRDGWHLKHAFTDTNGFFHFDALANDIYLVVVEKVDYQTTSTIVAASTDGSVAAITLTYSATAVEGKQRAPWSINTSGPQYTSTADVEPAGSWYVEPWVYNERTPSQGTSTYYMPEHIALGLGHNFELDFWPTIAINNAGYPTTPRDIHASDWGFGNAHIQLKYGWMTDQDTYSFFAWPTISTSADLYVPTGNFTTDLHSDLYGTDQFSNGTVAEEVNVMLRKRFKPFEFYAEVGDLVADPTRVGPGYTFNNGITQMPLGAYERMVDGNLVWFGAAFEHVLDSDHGFGYVLEFTGASQSGSSLFFGHANAPGYSYLWAVPAVEVNWPSSGALVIAWGLGVGLPIAQSNFPRTYTPTATITIYWNGGGPRG